MPNRRVYQNVGALMPGRSAFDLSYTKTLTCDMGQLIPVMCDEVVPGDVFNIGNQSVVRFQPLVAPILHEINQYVHYFFVPYRLLWEDWEEFISRGVSGDETPVLPTWSPDLANTAVGTLWDYLGFPVNARPTGSLPLTFPRDAYNLVYNEYYRDENLQTEVLNTNNTILYRNWEKDYLTSALLTQQRGTAPALPITGTTHAAWTDSAFNVVGYDPATHMLMGTNPSTPAPQFIVYNTQNRENLKGALNNNVVDLSSASTFDIADLRLAFQIQKWMERNNRAGVRYTEFLRAHFGVSPTDDRLQRPEYIGGSKSPIIVSEVLQTSSTDGTSPQGNLAGHGIGVSSNFCGKYHAKEYGLIIGIMSVMPKPMYQQGINRQWLKQTCYDFFFPEFVNLSEQAITNAEVCVKDNNSTHNTTLFGYQGRYDELRTKNNQVCGLMRTDFDYWHMGRIFDPASPPQLNSSFVKCIPTKRIFASETTPGLIVSFANLIKAFRPLPVTAEPGLVDHN